MSSALRGEGVKRIARCRAAGRIVNRLHIELGQRSRAIENRLRVANATLGEVQDAMSPGDVLLEFRRYQPSVWQPGRHRRALGTAGGARTGGGAATVRCR